MDMQKYRFVIPRAQKEKSAVKITNIAGISDVPIEQIFLKMLDRILAQKKVTAHHEPA